MNVSIWRGLIVTLSLCQGMFLLADPNCFAQYRHHYHRHYGYVRGYGGYGGASTVAEGAGIGYGYAARGLGQLRAATGKYEIEHAKAKSYEIQAYQQYLKTIKLQRDAYEETKQAEKDRYNEGTAEERARVAAYQRDMAYRAAPHRLSEEQFDREHDIIHWPYVLRDSMFDESRYELDKLFAERTPDNSGAGSNNAAAVRKVTDKMLKIVRGDINNLDIDQFITAKHFIGSLAYEARFPVKASASSSKPSSKK